MFERAPVTRRRLRPALWLLVALLAACNLNTDSDSGPGSPVISGPPQVRIAAPLPNATYLEGVIVTIQALVTNAGADVQRVEVALDGAPLAQRSDPNPSGAPSFSVAETWRAENPGAHTITVTAFRADGSASEPAAVAVNVVSQGSSVQTQTPTVSSANDAASTPTSAPAAAPRATNTPAPPTDAPPPAATATPSSPQATFNVGVNVRRGPDTSFEPPIGSFAAGDTSEILAVNPARTWYKVRYWNGEGWVFGGLMSVSGDAANLPVDAGPPTPTPTSIPPTPVPPTAIPQRNINLVAGNITLNPDQPVCRETFQIFMDVANLGQEVSPSGMINVRNVHVASGTVTQTTQGAFPEIQPGQTVRVGPIPFTESTFFEEDHRLELTIDPNNQIPETTKDDNVGRRTYRLLRGGC